MTCHCPISRNTALHGKETGYLDETSIEDAKPKRQPHIIQNSRSQSRYKTDERRATETIRLQSLVCFTQDRKSTRLNSSHANISYAVFCLKKKKNKKSQSL